MLQIVKHWTAVCLEVFHFLSVESVGDERKRGERGRTNVETTGIVGESVDGSDGTTGVVECMHLLHVENRRFDVSSGWGLSTRVEEEDDSQAGLGNKGERILIESKDVNECPTA